MEELFATIYVSAYHRSCSSTVWHKIRMWKIEYSRETTWILHERIWIGVRNHLPIVLIAETEHYTDVLNWTYNADVEKLYQDDAVWIITSSFIIFTMHSGLPHGNDIGVFR